MGTCRAEGVAIEHSPEVPEHWGFLQNKAYCKNNGLVKLVSKQTYNEMLKFKKNHTEN